MTMMMKTTIITLTKTWRTKTRKETHYSRSMMRRVAAWMDRALRILNGSARLHCAINLQHLLYRKDIDIKVTVVISVAGDRRGEIHTTETSVLINNMDKPHFCRFQSCKVQTSLAFNLSFPQPLLREFNTSKKIVRRNEVSSDTTIKPLLRFD